MNVEALWSVAFSSNIGFAGAGVAVFETGRVFGGDSTMIYVGSYRVDGDVVKAEVKIEKYAHASGMVSVVGMDSFTLEVSGKLDIQKMHLHGHVKGRPDLTMEIEAVRRAELP